MPLRAHSVQCAPSLSRSWVILGSFNPCVFAGMGSVTRVMTFEGVGDGRAGSDNPLHSEVAE